MMYVRTRYRGLGDAQSAAQTVGTISSIGTPVATTGIASALSAPTAVGGTAILGLAPALAVPLIGAALAAVTLAVTYLIKNSGCGPTCIQATQYANQSATLMQQNMQAYFSLPAPRPKSAQTQALANFDALWQKLVQLCSDPALGNAGKRCISERQPGGKYDDAKFNRDPIANDPNVYDDSQTSLPGLPGALLSPGSGSSVLPLLALGALVVLGVTLL